MQNTQALSGAALAASTLGVDTQLAPPDRGSSEPQRGGLDTAARYVSDNPWYAAVIAIGAGIVLGLLLPRK